MLDSGPDVPFHDEPNPGDVAHVAMPEIAPTSGAISEIAIERIAVGYNHRKHFDEAAIDELAASIRHVGVIQPVTVRPMPDGGFELVAGGRRLRAAARAGLASIPCYVRVMDDATALTAGLDENAKREGVSVSEEAQACTRALSLADGDEAEAARLLGWSRSKLKARLLLLNASQEVLDAQMTRQITLGHCELLATLPVEVQSKLLPRLLESKASVDEFRKQLASYAKELASACFDTAGCAGCPNNSTTQADMFDTSIGGGRCSNHSCWSEKTEAHLQGMKVTLSAEVAVVYFDRDKTADSYVKLSEVGSTGVGPTQFAACKGCGHYGSSISTKPGSEGVVTTGLCFNRTCNSEKVSAYAAELKENATPKVAPPAPQTQTGATASRSAPTTSADKASTPDKAPQPSVASIPKRVMEANCAEMRKLATAALTKSPRMQTAALLYGLHLATRDKLRNPLAEGSGGTLNRPALTLREFAVLSDEEMAKARDAMLGVLFTAAGSGLSHHADPYTEERIVDCAAVVAVTQAAPSDTFVLTKEYLGTHTKALIEALLLEAGFPDSMAGDTPEAKKRAFRAFMAQGRDDIINQVMASTHDFKGFVPSHLLKGLSESIKKDPSIVKKVRALRAGQ